MASPWGASCRLRAYPHYRLPSIDGPCARLHMMLYAFDVLLGATGDLFYEDVWLLPIEDPSRRINDEAIYFYPAMEEVMPRPNGTRPRAASSRRNRF
jgi:hypothetical protein